MAKSTNTTEDWGKGDEIVAHAQDWGKNDEIIAPAKAVSQTPQDPGWFQPGSQSEALVRGASQGATLGFGDEIQAGLRSPFMKQPGESVLDAYRRLRDEERNANSSSAQANPGSYTAGTLVGSLPSAIAAPSTGVAKVAGFNAVLGALAGAGNSDTDATTLSGAGQMAKDAASSGVLTAGVGAVGQGIGNVIQKSTNVVKNLADAGKSQTQVDGLVKALTAHTTGAPAPSSSELFPSAVATTKKVVGAVGDNLKSNLSDLLTKGPSNADMALGAVGAMLGGVHGALGLVGAKKMLLNASIDATKQHAAELGNAVQPAAAVAQKFAPVVKQALQKGMPFAAINNVLQQQSPEYRQMLRSQQEEPENDSGN